MIYLSDGLGLRKTIKHENIIFSDKYNYLSLFPDKNDKLILSVSEKTDRKRVTSSIILCKEAVGLLKEQIDLWVNEGSIKVETLYRGIERRTEK